MPVTAFLILVALNSLMVISRSAHFCRITPRAWPHEDGGTRVGVVGIELFHGHGCGTEAVEQFVHVTADVQQLFREAHAGFGTYKARFDQRFIESADFHAGVTAGVESGIDPEDSHL